MKSKHLLLTLLLALLVPWAASAQTTVEIGDGTVTCNTNPIGTYYNYSITEQLYTAEEIGMAGTINSVSFYYKGIAAKDLPITMYMMQTDAENLSTGISLADADEVFTGTLSVTTTAGWVTIELDTPFAYDGTSNLLIGFIKDYLYYFSGQSWQGTATTATMARYTQNDNNAYTTSTTPGTAQANRPNIQIVITAGSGPVCDKPETFEVSNVTSTSATLTWTGGSGNYNVEYKGGSAEDWTTYLTNTTATTANLTGLTPGTNYQYRVQSVCGDETSGWKGVNFMTMFGIPLVEEFGTVIPTGWAQYTGLLENVMAGTAELTSNTYAWSFGASSNGVFDNHARVNIYGTSCMKWLVLPTLAMENNVQLMFDVAYTAYSGTGAPATDGTDDKFVVLVNAGHGWTILRQWDNAGSEYVLNDLNTTPLTVALDLSSYAGNNVAIAFYGESTVSNADNNLHIDNVNIDYIPACPKPTGLTASNVTGHAATISWTSDASAWQIQLGEETPIDVTEPTYTFTGLDPETTYAVKVRANCSGAYSDWSNVSFTTTVACPAPTVAVSNITAYTAEVSCTNTDAESFNVMLGDEVVAENVAMPYTLTDLTPDQSYTVKVQAICGGEDGESEWSSTTFTTAEICPEGMICIGTGKSTNSYLPTHTYYNYSFTQQIYTAEEIGGAGAIMSIDFYNVSDVRTRNLDIYMVYTEKESFTGTSDWIAVEATDLVYSGSVTFAADAWTTIALDSPFQYADDTKNVAIIVHDKTGGYVGTSSWAFRAFSATSQAIRAYNDNYDYDPSTPGTYVNNTTYTGTVLSVKNRVRLVMGEITDCDMPTNLAVSDITMETANLTWTAGGSETAWQLCINGDEENLIDVTNNAYQLTGLTAATTYTVKVRANCGESQSYWTPEISFNTALCNAADQCVINYEFSVGNSYTTWHSATIDVVDVETNLVLATLTYDQAAPTGSVTVCDGREISFVYHPATPAYYNQYNYFTFTDVNEEEIFSGAGTSNMADPTVLCTHTVSCMVTSCRRPTNLVISEIDKHSAKLSWTENGDATEWVVAYTTDSVTFTEMSATETVATITGLATGTNYSVKVRPVCDLDYWWSNAVTFTTEEACPMDINNVAVNYITNNEATVVWEGTHDNYQVQYRTAETSQLVYPEGSFGDDFENGLDNWTIYQEGEAGGNWSITNPSTWSGSYAAHSGSYVAVARSYNGSAFNADNWLVSPQVTIPASMSYWMMGDATYPETYDICVSTTGNAVADFTSVVSYDTNPDDWTLVTVDLSAYEGQTGYIAFHQYGYDADLLWIDDVNIGGETVIIPAGEWRTIETADLAAAITGLTAATTYEYQVRGYCAEEGAWSSWTAMATFTTLDVCATPENLVIVPGANSAILTWEGVQDEYYLMWVDAAAYNSGTYTIQDAEVTGTYFEMTGLESGYEYYVNVFGKCSDTQYSSYLAGSFTTALLWTDPETWDPEGNTYPGESNPEPVTIPDNMTVVIPAGTETNPTVIEVTTIDLPATSQIIIEENAELIYAVTDPTAPDALEQGVDVTMSMTIEGVSNAKGDYNNGYRLIASPIYETIGVEDCGLTANYYGMDLYSFDAGAPHEEWRNYKTGNNFSELEIGKGYLYYNSETVFVTFAGQTIPSNVTYHIDLAYSENAQCDEWKGLNLVGNPFTCKATPDKDFYVLNEAGDEIVTTASTEAYVAPMKGFFVVANGVGDQCNMNKYTEPNYPGTGGGGGFNPGWPSLNIKLNHNQSLTDVAVVKFGKGENLRKVQLNSNHTKLYMPLDSYDYATMYTDSNVGEMPVNFKAEHSGSYTLSFANDNVEFSYLHLIDNMTGNDVDLLVNPTYSFNAQTTDYASRFRLVYATGSSVDGDSFGFINGMGNLCIFGIDGEATLQVMDVLGHVISSNQFSGSFEQKLNVAPGVYMIRLINGNDVKVQKIVVK